MAADQYTNAVGVATIRDWANGKFALDSDLDSLSERVDDIVAEGGEPNVIEGVQKNGTDLPVVGKKVNVTVPTTVAELSDASDYAQTTDIPTAVSDLTNDGDGTSPFATQAYVGTNGGKIDSISVNTTPATIDANKNVDITVPTAVSDLTNDSGFQTSSEVSSAITTALANGNDPYTTESDVESAISTAVSSAYKYKGSVANQAALPASGNTTGDVYDTQDTGMNYAWNGTAWDALGTYVDTSVLWTSTAGQSNSLTAMTVAEVNAILEPSS